MTIYLNRGMSDSPKHPLKFQVLVCLVFLAKIFSFSIGISITSDFMSCGNYHNSTLKSAHHRYSDRCVKCTVVNRTLHSLYGGSLKITSTRLQSFSLHILNFLTFTLPIFLNNSYSANFFNYIFMETKYENL